MGQRKEEKAEQEKLKAEGGGNGERRKGNGQVCGGKEAMAELWVSETQTINVLWPWNGSS